MLPVPKNRHVMTIADPPQPSGKSVGSVKPNHTRPSREDDGKSVCTFRLEHRCADLHEIRYEPQSRRYQLSSISNKNAAVLSCLVNTFASANNNNINNNNEFFVREVIYWATLVRSPLQ
jgi:hypothetical protein